MEVSVIIPTYNRCDILLETLQHLYTQDFDKGRYEVIVVNDGSTDETAAKVREFARNHSDMELKYMEQENQGPSVARNLGLDKASGGLVLFIGDDILCPPDLLDNHIKAHNEENLAITGPQIWTDAPTAFMKLLVDNARGAKERVEIGMSAFCTANVSIKRKWLLKERFDEQIRMGYEDTELGFRLHKLGLKILYDPKPKVYHKHYYSLDAFRKKLHMHGKAAPLILRKHPELRSFLIPSYPFVKRSLCRIMLAPGLIQRFSAPMHARLEWLVHYVNGIEEGAKEYEVRL